MNALEELDEALGKHPTSPEYECLEAVLLYFSTIGCTVVKKNSGRGMFDLSPTFVTLPKSITRWNITINGDVISAEIELDIHDRWHNRNCKTLSISLTDPESLPKLLAHMQKHSKFLRGGLSNHIPVIKAV